MKNQSFARRLSFATAGIRVAFRQESSFRTQIYFVPLALLLLTLLQAPPIWWGLLIVTTSGVLTAELFNTSLELLADRLHPESHVMIGHAKNCAAGAVLVMSLCSSAIALALIVERWPWLTAMFRL